MGIVNVTPDSFSDGGEYADTSAAVQRARELVAAGADIIDVGGESTRPGAAEVRAAAELARTLPVVSELAMSGIVVSIDTRHADVAAACVNAGAAIINDVSGFRSSAMVEVARQCQTGVIIMHMLGEPASMQSAPRYGDVVREVSDYLLTQAQMLTTVGIAKERIAIDPGPGFGKDFAHNLSILSATSELAALGYPLVAAWSRKAFIGELGGGIADPKQRDELSAQVALQAARDGARILRVHNVAATVKALDALPRRALIALGSNMGYASGIVSAAIEAIALLDGVQLVSQSRIYRSEPAYLEAQPAFANAVVQVATTLGPKQLLHALQGLEQRYGRVRLQRNGPRTLDLDIIDIEGECSADPELLLPHPLALERDFVVTPLLQIAPHYVLADGTAVARDRVRIGWVFADEVGTTVDTSDGRSDGCSLDEKLGRTGRADRDDRIDLPGQPDPARPPDLPGQPDPARSPGKLSVCATPIGNLGDITRRVVEALGAADLVLAEDTRVTRKLLSHLGIRTRLERCDENVIRSMSERIVRQIKAGAKVVFVSDAGTPGVADPGSVLVNAAIEAGCKVEVLPGASAVLTALVASGLAGLERGTSDGAFYFGGFMPRKSIQIRRLLERLSQLERPLVFFESPHRTLSTLKIIVEMFPLREMAIARELTKLHEELLRGTATELCQVLQDRERDGQPLKGEIVLVMAAIRPSAKERVHVDRYAAKQKPL